jgi:antitoxin component YwqK of YwqJK toxin-antitoxin module
MNKIIIALSAIAGVLIFSSCGNDVEEIKDPSTGKLLKRFEYFTDDSGQKIKDGEYIEWDAAGKKISKLHYKEDSLHGSCTYYLDNGNILENNFSMGKLSGDQFLKTRNGKVIHKEHFEHGLLDGKQEYRNSNGELQRLSFFTNGKPSGTWTYYEKGKKYFTLNFKNGICQELIGTWNITEERATSMKFGDDGSFKLYAPYFDNFGDPVLRVDGTYQIDEQLHAVHKNGITMSYELFYVSKDTVILIDKDAESPSTAITELIRRK